jgi:hypothetical protein
MYDNEYGDWAGMERATRRPGGKPSELDRAQTRFHEAIVGCADELVRILVEPSAPEVKRSDITFADDAVGHGGTTL